MRYMVESNFVRVWGLIWLPNVEAGMEYTLRDYDIKNIGPFTRENVERWLRSNAGDFSKIVDFYATVGDDEIHWANEENEMKYSEACGPSM